MLTNLCACGTLVKQALRIVLASVASHAARYKRYIVPVSCSPLCVFIFNCAPTTHSTVLLLLTQLCSYYAFNCAPTTHSPVLLLFTQLCSCSFLVLPPFTGLVLICLLFGFEQYMSCSIDFYCRIFVRVYTSAAEVKKTGW